MEHSTCCPSIENATLPVTGDFSIVPPAYRAGGSETIQIAIREVRDQVAPQ
jgi:hypothetical protein